MPVDEETGNHEKNRDYKNCAPPIFYAVTPIEEEVDEKYCAHYETILVFPIIIIISIINLLTINNFFIYLICINSLLLQIFHYWTHANTGNIKISNQKLINLLRKFNLILKPEIHKIHHTLFDRNYAILNGWSNPLLNKIFINEKIVKKYVNLLDKILN